MLLEARRGKHIGRGEDGRAAQFPNAGFREHVLGALPFRGLAFALGGFHQPPPGHGIRTRNLPGGLKQTQAFFGGHSSEQRPIASDGFEQFGGVPQALGQRGGLRFIGCGSQDSLHGAIEPKPHRCCQIKSRAGITRNDAVETM